MNVKSKYATDEEETVRPNQSMRGMCGAPFSMIEGPTRVDVRSVHAPRFLKWIFRTLGWKTEADQDTDH
jgi:hypothetical protein